MSDKSRLKQPFARDPLLAVGAAIKCAVLAGVLCGLAWISVSVRGDPVAPATQVVRSDASESGTASAATSEAAGP
jgi:hypothetical protein